MKYVGDDGLVIGETSRPARGGWIEINHGRSRKSAQHGPAPHGAGGLKFLSEKIGSAFYGPAPHGAGGLKSKTLCLGAVGRPVPPRTGRVD